MSNLEDLINECYNKRVEKVTAIYEIFKDQFGEEKVDLQGIKEKPINLSISSLEAYNTLESEIAKRNIVEDYIRTITDNTLSIIVYWPHVKVTNEYDKFTEIDDLWGKVEFTYEGKLLCKFRLNRSSYSYLHISNNYMHSHVSSIPFDELQNFQSPCTGTGPINSTITSLMTNYDEDIWRLFCCELNNFVYVESLAGVPYHRLESLGSGDNAFDYRNFRIETELGYYQTRYIDIKYWREFIKFIVRKQLLKFSFYSNNYHIGMSIPEVTILLSNLFIEWYNQSNLNETLDTLLERKILRKGIYSGGIIYGVKENDIRDYTSFIGKKVLTFKGKDILLKIDDFSEESENYSLILSSNIIYYILTIILQVLNYRYGREKSSKSELKINGATLYV